MKTKPDIKDTVITLQHSQIHLCSAKGHCPNHPNKTILIQKFTSNATQTLDSIQDVQQIQKVEPVQQIEQVIEVVKPKKEIKLTAFDSIKPCSDSFLRVGDNRLSHEFISIPEIEIEKPVTSSFDNECLSLTFGFVVFLSLKYAINSASKWTSMFSEIKQIVNS
jgi:hypothetical protein